MQYVPVLDPYLPVRVEIYIEEHLPTSFSLLLFLRAGRLSSVYKRLSRLSLQQYARYVRRDVRFRHSVILMTDNEGRRLHPISH